MAGSDAYHCLAVGPWHRKGENMNTAAAGANRIEPAPSIDERPRGLLRTEDWWAICIGVGLVIVATILFKSGASIKWLAIVPGKWSSLDELPGQFAARWPQYLALYVLFAVLFGIGTSLLGIKWR